MRKSEKFIPNEEQVRKICEMLVNGFTDSEICDSIFGKVGTVDSLTRTHRMQLVSAIRKNRRHVDIKSQYFDMKRIIYDRREQQNPGKPHNKTSEIEVIMICELLSYGLSNQEIISIMYPNISDKKSIHTKETILSNIRNGHSHVNISSRYSFPGIGENIGEGECYYPRETIRVVVVNKSSIEEICRKIIQNDLIDARNLLYDTYMKCGIELTHKKISNIIWRIKNRLLYNDIYTKCLTEKDEVSEIE